MIWVPEGNVRYGPHFPTRKSQEFTQIEDFPVDLMSKRGEGKLRRGNEKAQEAGGFRQLLSYLKAITYSSFASKYFLANHVAQWYYDTTPRFVDPMATRLS